MNINNTAAPSGPFCLYCRTFKPCGCMTTVGGFPATQFTSTLPCEHCYCLDNQDYPRRVVHVECCKCHNVSLS